VSLRRLFESHPHWQEILTVCQKLSKVGYETLLAGGCVRDGLLNIQPHDFDIASQATPDVVQKLFPEALDVGRKFGVMILPREGYRIEIATFRHDGPYKDGRHPEFVQFSTAQADAERRDFTVNALFYNPNTDQVIDYVQGLLDLKGSCLRAVGDPALRFEEDKLRILRAVRFSAQLNFKIEPKTLQEVKNRAKSLVAVSKERITDEMKKLVKTEHAVEGFHLLRDTGLLEVIFPNLHWISNEEQWTMFQKALRKIEGTKSWTLVLTLLSLMEKEAGDFQFDSCLILFSREEKQAIAELRRGIDLFRAKRMDVLLVMNTDLGPLLTELAYALSALGLLQVEPINLAIDQFLAVCSEEGELPRPLLNGQDLLLLGIQPSARMGQLLADAYLRQLAGEFKNQAMALNWVKSQK
jgi:tRNA nucleotidyltransferase (CCA-adding enzyme)